MLHWWRYHGYGRIFNRDWSGNATHIDELNPKVQSIVTAIIEPAVIKFLATFFAMDGYAAIPPYLPGMYFG